MITIDITMVFQMINIIALMFILNAVLYKPIKKILKERADKMNLMQGDVAKYEKNARLRQEEVDAKMASASKKAKAALDSARDEAQAAGSEKLAAIKAEADAEKEKQLVAVHTQITEARAGLDANIKDFAAAMAGKILGRAI